MNYYLKVGQMIIWITPSLSLLNSEFTYRGNDLGPIYHQGGVEFKVWSPTATALKLILFNHGDPDRRLCSKTMQRQNRGIWFTKVTPNECGVEDLAGTYYQYEVTALGKTKRAIDPYARSMASFNPNAYDKVGKSAIVNPSSVSFKELDQEVFSNKQIMANSVDFVGYELHTRDFTIRANEKEVPAKLKGTYLGLTYKIPHLKDLGITHVQIMPLQNFYTVNEADRSFSDEHTPTQNINYNWGYDPHNYFTPEGWYSTNPQDPYNRIIELKKMVRELHKNKIGVILDVVYNHTYKSDTFENIAPGCYYRTDSEGHISNKTGAGPTVETRVNMVAKLIIDSLVYWQKTYHIDGFRFDLMGFMDKKLMENIRKALGEDSILYGEAWDLSDLPKEQASTKYNLADTKDLSAFSDTIRDAIKGYGEEPGFIQEQAHLYPRIKAAVIASLQDQLVPFKHLITQDPYHRYAKSPAETLNYVSIHDGYTLFDKLSISHGGEPKEIIRLMKLALAMVFTAQGRVVIHSGTELARSKPLYSNDPVIHPRKKSKFHHNSYRSPDLTNGINWERLKKFPDLFQYVKGLIKLRRSLPHFRLEEIDEINNQITFFDQSYQAGQMPTHIAYEVRQNPTLLVVHNGANSATQVSLPSNVKSMNWKVILDANQVSLDGIENSNIEVMGSRIKVPRRSSVILLGN